MALTDDGPPRVSVVIPPGQVPFCSGCGGRVWLDDCCYWCGGKLPRSLRDENFQRRGGGP